MTKREWLKCKEPALLMKVLEEKASNRKLRLFMCGCCRQLGPVLADPQAIKAIELSEQFADGLVDKATLVKIRRRAEKARVEGNLKDYQSIASLAAVIATWITPMDWRSVIRNATDAMVRSVVSYRSPAAIRKPIAVSHN